MAFILALEADCMAGRLIRILMLTLIRADILFECKARVDPLYLILGQTLTGS